MSAPIYRMRRYSPSWTDRSSLPDRELSAPTAKPAGIRRHDARRDGAMAHPGTTRLPARPREAAPVPRRRVPRARTPKRRAISFDAVDRKKAPKRRPLLFQQVRASDYSVANAEFV